MIEPIHLTNLEARRYLLVKHGLWPPRALYGTQGVMAVFDRLGSIQFDPLDVVGRNPDLVLQSRVAGYRPDWLKQMMYVERRFFDYWDKMMSVVPLQHWPRLELQRARWRERHTERLVKNAKHVQTILEAISEQGPMSSLDFKTHHGVDWKTDWRWGKMRAAKALLEMLLDTGDLMVSRREAARRYYDLSERVLPDEIAAQPLLTDQETYVRWRLARRCQGLGLIGPALGGEAWAGLPKAPRRAQAIKAMVEFGALTPVKIEGDGRTYHLLTQDLDHVERARAAAPPARAAFVAPLDNLLWSRNLIERLFGFRYVWEVYKPAEQRRYGYYVLPVLYGDRFVARFDTKLNREEGILQVLSWHWEPGESPTAAFADALQEGVSDFLSYLGAARVVAAEGVDPAVTALMHGFK